MKKAIVVGATSGIGQELAKTLVNNGYTVGITGRRIENLKNLHSTNPSQYIISAFDATIDNNDEKLTELANKLGGLNLLVLSSGTGELNKNLDIEIEHKTNLLNVNTFTKIVNWSYKYFENQNKGHIVVISSIAGIRGSGLAPAYNASKAYQINYLEGLRQKTTKTKKTINIIDVRPGFVDTDMAKGDGLFWVSSKEKAASQIFNAIKKKKEIVYISKRWKLIAIVLKIIPNTFYKRM